MMTRSTPHLALCLWALVTAACNNTPTSPNYENNGGSNSGGSANGGSGGSAGNSGSGGASSSGSSTSAGGSGGNTAAGGSAGNPASGGSSGSGGNSKGSGGATVGSGGSSVTGGNSGSGGSSVTGGSAGSGGSSITGGASGTGGVTGQGGSSGAKDAGVLRDSGNGPEVAKGAEVGGGDATSTVSYKSQIQPLLQTYCSSCHSGSTANAGIDVSTYANVSKSAKAINSAIQNGSMPLTGGPLTSAEKQLFQTWVNAGSPNN